MEKERLFKEMFVQHKASQGSDGIQRRNTSGGKSMGDLRGIPHLDVENIPSPSMTS